MDHAVETKWCKRNSISIFLEQKGIKKLFQILGMEYLESLQT